VILMADRTAHVTWSGSLMEGNGTITSVDSGAFGPLAVTWAARAETDSAGLTSPEELIAAAHAACFSMALSHGLAQAGTPPDKLDVDATLTFVPGTGITKIALAVRGAVPGLDEAAFVEAAEAAKVGCPVSKALAAVPEITLEASLS
jgi:lipoyl-dependent peroxiredoxin